MLSTSPEKRKKFLVGDLRPTSCPKDIGFSPLFAHPLPEPLQGGEQFSFPQITFQFLQLSACKQSLLGEMQNQATTSGKFFAPSDDANAWPLKEIVFPYCASMDATFAIDSMKRSGVSTKRLTPESVLQICVHTSSRTIQLRHPPNLYRAVIACRSKHVA